MYTDGPFQTLSFRSCAQGSSTELSWEEQPVWHPRSCYQSVSAPWIQDAQSLENDHCFCRLHFHISDKPYSYHTEFLRYGIVDRTLSGPFSCTDECSNRQQLSEHTTIPPFSWQPFQRNAGCRCFAYNGYFHIPDICCNDILYQRISVLKRPVFRTEWMCI